MLIQSDKIKRISGLLFEVVILAFIVSYSWMDSQHQDKELRSDLAFKPAFVEQIIVRDNSSVEFLKNPISKIQKQEIEFSIYSLVLPNLNVIKAASLAISFFERNTFYVFTSINAP